MRISDWSSDVCSSDLPESGEFPDTPLNIRAIGIFNRLLDTGWFRLEKYGIEKTVNMAPVVGQLLTQLIGFAETGPVFVSGQIRSIDADISQEIGRASRRERGCQYV